MKAITRELLKVAALIRAGSRADKPKKGDVATMQGGRENFVKIDKALKQKGDKWLVEDQDGEERWVERDEGGDTAQRKGWKEVSASSRRAKLDVQQEERPRGIVLFVRVGKVRIKSVPQDPRALESLATRQKIEDMLRFAANQYSKFPLYFGESIERGDIIESGKNEYIVHRV